MQVQAGDKVLGGRYEFIRVVKAVDERRASELWLAEGEYQELYLAKVWPARAGQSSAVERALWDRELRTMYRVCSSPSAERSLLVIRDAGVDQRHGAFVMMLRAAEGAANGYTPLADVLRQRSDHDWLSNRDERARRHLWQGLRLVARGVQLLHTQRVLHRNVEAANVFLNPDVGPATFRLSGFEWSVRLGELHLAAGRPPSGLCVGHNGNCSGICGSGA